MFMSKKFFDNGFTLVELMAVLAITGILFSVGFIGVKGYMSYACYKKNNETAKAVFTQVQTALTEKKADGVLNEFFYEAEKLKQSVPTDGYEEYDYIKLGKNTDENDKNRELLKKLLQGYYADPAIWKGSVCVEINFTDGVAASVWYSEQAEDLEYAFGDNVNSLNKGVLPIGNPNIDRRSIGLGYYGTEPLKTAANKAKRPVIDSLSVNNGEVLDINWKMEEGYENPLDMNYYVTFFSKENNAKMQLLIQGSDLLPSDDYRYVKCKYALFNENGDILPFDDEIGLLCRVGKADYDIHIIADGLDINSESIFTGENGLKNKEEILAKDLEKTCCGLKLAYICGINPMDDFFVRVQAIDSDGNLSLKKESSHTNLLMGGGNDKADFTIENGRHLYNLRYIEALFEYNGKDELKICQTKAFNWGGNEGIAAAGNAFDSSASDIPKKIEPDRETDLDFIPVKEVKEGSFIFSGEGCKIGNLNIDGKDMAALFYKNYGEISGLELDNCYFKGGECGSVCAENFGSIADVKTENVVVEGEENVGGIVGINKGKISGCYFGGQVLGNCSSAGGTGGIAGTNGSDQESVRETAVIENCFVSDNRDINTEIGSEEESGSDYTIFGNGSSIGGICGNNCYSGIILGSLPEKCSVRGDIGYVGGVAGRNGGVVRDCFGKNSVNADSLKELENDGKTSGKEFALYLEKALAERENTPYDVKISGGGYAGGIVGFNDIYGIVNNCASGGNFAVEVRVLGENMGEAGCGGCIGLNMGENSLINIYNNSDVYMEFEEDSFTNCGGILAMQQGGGEIRNCFNFGNVFGKKRAGGIVSCIYNKNGKIEGCGNYGSVFAAEGNCGGIFGEYDYSLKCEDCLNFGEVFGSVCGGIGGKSSMCIVLSRCENAGYVHGALVGGILGSTDTAAVKGSGIFRCVNYYEFKQGEAAVAGKNSGRVVINGCFNVLGGGMPVIADNCGGGENYYFGRVLTEGTEGLEKGGLKEILVYSVNYVWRGEADLGGEKKVIILPYNPNDGGRTPWEAYKDMHGFYN